MTPEEVVTLFRSEMGDSTEPYLWTPSEVATYLTEAHSLFVRGIGGIAALDELVFTAGEREAEAPPGVLTYRYIRDTAEERNIELRNAEESDFGTQPRRPAPLRNGKPTEAVIGLVDGKIFFETAPTVSGSFDVAYYRDTGLVFTEDNLSSVRFEIKNTYHRSLVYGMSMQALLKQDADTFDRRRSDQMEVLFSSAILTAKLERDRANNKPRLIAYGGI